MALKVYDDALSNSVCNSIIDIFEKNPDHQQHIDNNKCPCFTQVNINEISGNIVQFLIPFVKEVHDRYKRDIDNRFCPSFNSLEEFRIKRYNTSGDEKFNEHIDVTRKETSIRSLAFLFYLNDNDGNTVFPRQDLIITPTPGRVVVFPPFWEYPHAGLPPTNNSKYIMSTYIHYDS